MGNSAAPHVPKKNISRLYPRLGLWIGIAGLLMIGALWIVTVQIVKQDHEDEVRGIVQVQSNILKAMESHVLDILDDADNMLLFMKESYERHGFISDDTRDVLRSTNFSRFTSQAGVLDENGYFLFSLRPVLPGVNLSDRPYFMSHIRQDTGKPFLGSILMGRVSGKSSFHLSRRFNKADGSFGGVVVLAVGAEYFAEAFQRITLEKMNFFLFGRDGIVRATDAASASLLGIDLRGGTVFGAMEKEPHRGAYLAKVMYLEAWRFVSYREVEGYPLYVAVAIDEEVALERFYERRGILYGIAGVISAVLVLMMTVLREMLRRQDQLRGTILAEKERAENYLEMAGSLIVALDLEGRVTLLNRRGCEILGVEPEELLGEDWFDNVIPPENRVYVRNVFRQMIAEVKPIRDNMTDMVVMTQDGGRRIISWLNNLLRNPNGEVIGTLSSGTDVTERRQMEAELLRLATTDPLTGIHNRRSFLEKGRRDFEVFRRYERPLSLLMIDIDCFKKINDYFGHAAGDQVLIRLAEIFRKILRSVDLCGRFGGEEFICMLPETSADKALIEADRLRQALAEQEVLTKAGKISFTVSIGVSTALPEDESIEALIQRADAAMYVAKRAGRNRVVAG